MRADLTGPRACDELMNAAGACDGREPLARDERRRLVEVFERVLRVHARPDALNYKRGGEWRSLSTEEFMLRARRVALGLNALGVLPGERAAILSESLPEWVIADAGCLMAGVVNEGTGRAMQATLAEPGFWASLAAALLLAGGAAYPANRWLLARGKGHAVVHAHHAH